MSMTDDEIISYWKGAYDRMAARSIEDGERIAAFEGENKRLREALLPFSVMAGAIFSANKNANDPIYGFGTPEGVVLVTAGDFFAARKAFETKS
jgi:hypothetical protein